MSKSIPTTRGYVILASAGYFSETGGDLGAVFEDAGLPKLGELQPDALIPAERYYDLFNRMAAKSQDQFFAARTGVFLARHGLPALAEARKASSTLGEFLTRIQMAFRNSVSNAYYDLRTDGGVTVLRTVRPHTFKSATNAVDVMNAAAFVTVICDAVGWTGTSRITVALSDPESLPSDLVPRKSVMRSASIPMSISFPTEWLLEPLRQEWSIGAEDVSTIDERERRGASLDMVKTRIAEQVANGDPTLANVARDVGLSARQLQRLISTGGSSFRYLVSEARLQMAREFLESSKEPVGSIAQSCGFSSSAALSKAFKSATGETPTEFRRRSSEAS